MAGGRPTKYTQELADEICANITLGDSIRTVCKPEHMPAISTFYKWLRENEEFAKQYARATEERSEAMAEEILDLADDASNVVLGIDKSDNARVSAMKLRVDTRKWLMAKMKPKKYGDKLDMTTNGKDITVPVPLQDLRNENK